MTETTLRLAKAPFFADMGYEPHAGQRAVHESTAPRRVVIRNMGGGISQIRAKSPHNPVSLLGEGLDWLIVDEASRLKPTISASPVRACSKSSTWRCSRLRSRRES